jgi:hypothetical protein
VSDYSDTIPVTGHTILVVDLDIKNLELYELNILINDQKINTYNQNEIKFHAEQLGQGFHPLKVQVTTTSGSGSLADVYNLEGLYAEFYYTLYVDIDPPHSLKIIDFSNENGMLKINWERYNRINFSSYILYKFYNNTNSSGIQLFASTNQNTTEYLDNSFIGGECYYAVAVVSSQGVKIVGDKFRVYDNYARLKDIKKVDLPDSIDDSVYELSWSKTDYYNNFYKYKLSSYYEILNAEVFDINTTSVRVYDLPFGRNIPFILTTFPAQHYGTATDTLNFNFGEPTFEYNSVTHNPHNGNTYYIHQPYLSILSSNGTVSSFENVYIPYSVFSKDKIYMSTIDALEIHNNVGFQLEEKIPVSLFYQSHKRGGFKDLISVSDNGIFVAAVGESSNNDSVIVYNTISKKVIGSVFRSYSNNRNFRITPNGKHVILDNILYEIESDNLVEKLSINKSGWQQYSGFAGNTALFTIDYSVYPACVKIYSLMSYQLDEEFYINATALFGDKIPFESKILVYDTNTPPNITIYLVDLLDQKSKKLCKAFEARYFLSQDTLYSSFGYKVNLNDL